MTAGGLSAMAHLVLKSWQRDNDFEMVTISAGVPVFTQDRAVGPN